MAIKLKLISTNIYNSDDAKLKVNKKARRDRHKKNFSVLYLRRVKNAYLRFTNLFSLKTISKYSEINGKVELPHTKLLKQVSIVSLILILVTSATPSSVFLETAYSADHSTEYAYYDDSLVLDQDGYLVKSVPQTSEGNRIGMSEMITYEIQPGDTISSVAARFDLNSSTILWENGLGKNSVIKPGQKIVIPPIDGVSHEVEKGEDLSEIAELYEVESDLIAKHNDLDGSVIAGSVIFVPGGFKIIEETNNSNTLVASNNVTGSASSTKTVTGASSSVTSPPPVDNLQPTGAYLIWPTNGKLTQGFHGGHYALDIANSGKPPVYASRAGTISEIFTGCGPRSFGCGGGGYGNYIKIDHGDGCETLYGHNEEVWVSVGQSVDTGQAIAKMGNTGNVYGVTGIHVHFELRCNGVKQNPLNYM